MALENSDLNALMEGLPQELWPQGFSPADVATLAILTNRERKVLTRRMNAIAAYLAGGATESTRHALAAGLSVPHFFVLLREWRDSRSLAAIAPNVRRTRSSTVDPKVRTEVEAAVSSPKDASDDGESKETLAQRLHRDLGGSPSMSVLRRLVDEERGRAERGEAGGFDGFGRRIVFDSAGLPLPVRPDGEGEAVWAVASFVVDVATGLILGFGLGHHETAGGMNAQAALNAVTWLEDRTLDDPLDPGRRTAFTVVIGHDDAMSVLREGARLLALPVDVTIVDGGGSYRQGAQLLRLIGRRVGTLELRPRQAKDFPKPLPESTSDKEAAVEAMTPYVAGIVVSENIKAYNEPLLAQLRRPAIPLQSVVEDLRILYDVRP